MTTTEHLVIKTMASNRQIANRYLPFIKPTYFRNNDDRLIFTCIKEFIEKYSGSPSKSAIELEIDDLDTQSDTRHQSLLDLLDDIWKIDPGSNLEFLHETIETFCKDRAIYNAIMESSGIYGGEIDKPRTEIASIVAEALSITFDNTVGGDMDDFEDRFDRYRDTSTRVPFNIDILNKVMRGGLPGGRTMIIGAGTNTGKSLIMCSFAAHNWRSGKNVLYISGEMDEDETFMRIEGNCLGMTVNDIPDLDKADYVAMMKRLYQRMPGKLKVKAFPMGTTTVLQFEALLKELKLKDGFVPDIVYVDYLGVFLSHRSYRGSGMYENGRYVSEDLRAFAQRNKLPVITGMQLNRGGYSSSDPDLDDSAESFAITHSADFIMMVTTSDELIKEGKFSCFIRKNRIGSKKMNHFMLGVDFDQQKVFDLDLSVPSKPIEKKSRDQELREEIQSNRSSLRRLNRMSENGNTV